MDVLGHRPRRRAPPPTAARSDAAGRSTRRTTARARRCRSRPGCAGSRCAGARRPRARAARTVSGRPHPHRADQRRLQEVVPVGGPQRVAPGDVDRDAADLGRVAVEEAVVQRRIQEDGRDRDRERGDDRPDRDRQLLNVRRSKRASTIIATWAARAERESESRVSRSAATTIQFASTADARSGDEPRDHEHPEEAERARRDRSHASPHRRSRRSRRTCRGRSIPPPTTPSK